MTSNFGEILLGKYYYIQGSITSVRITFANTKCGSNYPFHWVSDNQENFIRTVESQTVTQHKNEHFRLHGTLIWIFE